ncbi:hypothetical protein Lfu02_14350 [Longispora fulva]|uniref:Uncharacterized protein n=1 Tax=Longispora fulva TaxID=619741 RepID=A0A8J7GVW1_9ACTN|nr:hypothetical protein [Longispora fulva]MBG6140555.1 hypothetical protein [Longispora fulva]GIG57063.1 hypothetical protein Lfu02_14350 [Longispora fulva]
MKDEYGYPVQGDPEKVRLLQEYLEEGKAGAEDYAASLGLVPPEGAVNVLGLVFDPDDNELGPYWSDDQDESPERVG